jgi:hypothetical protein
VEGLEKEGRRRLRLERPLSCQSIPAGRRREPATRALGATLAIALLAGALAGCTSGSQAPPSTTTAATAATHGTTATTTPPASLEPYTWERDSSLALDLGGGATSTLSAVVAPGASADWLIAGTQFKAGGVSVATVWTSPNATRWSKTALPTPTGEGSAAANAATDWGSREVVVGSAGSGPTMRAAAWVSEAPGQPFVPIPDNPVFDAPTSGPEQGGAVMDTVAAGALGLFAGGTVNGRATVWYSTNGQQWQELSGATSVINHDPGAVVNDILSTPNGVFAAGSSVNADRLSAALWYSSDGIHWSTVRSAVSTFFGNGDHVITSVLDIGETGNAELGAPGPTGLLAVGGVRLGSNWQPASWISPNGFSWSQTSESFPLDEEPPGSPGAIAYAATGADGDLYAVGGSPGRQRLWQSSDGLAWSEVPLPKAAASDTGWHLGLVAANGHTTVLADNIPGQPYVLVDQDGRWHQPSAKGIFGNPLPEAVPTSLIADNGTLVMSVELSKPDQSLSSAPGSVAVLTSDNGSSWHTVSAHAFDGASVNQLLAVPDGLLAVGSAPLSGSQGGGATGGGATGGTSAFARLSSDDGTTWPNQVISPATLAGPVVATAAGRLGNSQYVVGQAGPEAVGWYSPDGNTWEAAQPLDSSPQLETERALATCVTGSSAVVVGSVTSTGRGSLPAAWVSTDGSSWTVATFIPTPPSGSSTTVEGCLSTGGGFLAYGESTGAGQVERPQLWASSDGTVWQQQSATFTGVGGGGPSGPQSAPLDGIAYGTTTWLGLSGNGDEPSQVWPAPIGGAAGAQFTPAGLWTSDDAGNTWQQLGTLTPAFTGMIYAQADTATYVGQEPVVAGTIDGQLAVWVGTPTASNPSATGTTSVTTATTATGVTGVLTPVTLTGVTTATTATGAS